MGGQTGVGARLIGRGMLALTCCLVAGCTAGGVHPPPAHERHRAPRAAAAGWQVVSYHGVHVSVPAAWPVVDGMHTLFCGSPFPPRPTAFAGPAGPPLARVPACPYIPRDLIHRDGVWLQPGSPPSDARPARTASGQVVLQERPRASWPLLQLWYHRVFIQIGIGPDPVLARSIFDSIGFKAGAPDTKAAGACARSARPQVMPRPERLTRRLVIDQGDITLAPPLRSDQPVMPAAQAWAQSLLSSQKNPFERYRLILARYSSKYPATPNPDGSYTPENTNVLAWVVYAAPYGAVPGCGGWGADAFDAGTGQEIDSSGWSPGP
jgi:hypothetical protein